MTAAGLVGTLHSDTPPMMKFYAQYRMTRYSNPCFYGTNTVVPMYYNRKAPIGQPLFLHFFTGFSFYPQDECEDGGQRGIVAVRLDYHVIPSEAWESPDTQNQQRKSKDKHRSWPPCQRGQPINCPGNLWTGDSCGKRLRIRIGFRRMRTACCESLSDSLRAACGGCSLHAPAGAATCWRSATSL